MIDFNSKISTQRFYDKTYNKPTDDYGLVKKFESDRGRILNSAAIRRLQQKTQVFPLERNAVVRTRLTHSLEVQQVGRYIVKDIFQKLGKKGDLNKYGLANIAMVIESMVEMACLMHDIGNPPFGHFGEAAINHWFKHYFEQNHHFNEIFNIKNDEKLNDLWQKITVDLCHFEGNAQAIRLVHTILKLNLTYSQIACILKYSKPAYFKDDVPDAFNYLMKKPGFYLSEEPFINQLMQKVGVKPLHRYAFTYIMEAADDISYCIADLEDAVEKRILSVEQLYGFLLDEWDKCIEDDLFDQVVNTAYNKVRDKKDHALIVDEFFMSLRVNTIAKLVPHASQRFIDNIESIFDGSFNHALLEDSSDEYRLLEIFKKVGFKHVFNHESVEIIELQGYRIINGLFDIYSPLLAMPLTDFSQLVADNQHKNYMIETRLYHKLSPKHKAAYIEAVNQLSKDSKEYKVLEFYYRARLLQDYISGMTDHFAFDEYRKLMVND